MDFAVMETRAKTGRPRLRVLELELRLEPQYINCSQFMATLYLHYESDFFMAICNCSIYIEIAVLATICC